MKISSRFNLILLALVSMAQAKDTECYTTTQSMIEAQAMGKKQLQICPNTTIKVGLPLNEAMTEWSGQAPLTIIADGVEVYCGPDKKSTNNCVFQDGFAHIISVVSNPLLPDRKITSTHNLKVTGITFTGTLTRIPGFTSVSVLISAPGTGMEFDDLVFRDMVVNHGFHIVDTEDDHGNNSNNSSSSFPPLSADMVLKNSIFTNVTYSHDLIDNTAQELHLQNVKIEGTQYNPEMCYDCQGATGSVRVDGMFELNDGGITDLTGVSIADSSFYTALITVRGEDTELSIDGLEMNNLQIYDQANRDPSEYCLDGLAEDHDPDDAVLDSCQSLLLVEDDDEELIEEGTSSSTKHFAFVASGLWAVSAGLGMLLF